jgi:hypothetical protein
MEKIYSMFTEERGNGVKISMSDKERAGGPSRGIILSALLKCLE